MANVFVRVWDAIRDQAKGKPTEGTTEELTEAQEKARDLGRIGRVVGGVIFVGASALVFWSVALARKDTPFSANVFGLGLFLLGGAALVGGVLGLLFGIPKSVSDPAAAAPLPSRTATDDSTKEQSDERQRSNYSVNTNLEQISDWLTKIIVGVGLTELTTIRAQFYNIADYFGKGFGSCGPGCPQEAGAVGAAVIMIYGLTAGFLAGYLFTRMFLPGAFRRADAEAAKLRQRLKDEKELRIELRTAAETAGRVQGEIYEELYKYNEQGFRQVIEKLDELLKSEVGRIQLCLCISLRPTAKHIVGPTSMRRTRRKRTGNLQSTEQRRCKRSKARCVLGIRGSQSCRSCGTRTTRSSPQAKAKQSMRTIWSHFTVRTRKTSFINYSAAERFVIRGRR
jgi:hypothetical protein